jgi:hypothetical protein
MAFAIVRRTHLNVKLYIHFVCCYSWNVRALQTACSSEPTEKREILLLSQPERYGQNS